MKFFVNPGRKRRKARKAKSSARRRRRTPPRGRGGRFVSRKRKARATVARKRRTRKRSSARRTTARRTRRRSVRRRSPVTVLKRRRVYATNPRRRRRRSYRRNPGFIGIMTRGLFDALAVTGGKVANNLVAKNLPFNLPLPGMAGDVVKSLGIATLVSWGASKFLGGDKARLVTAGAFQSVVEGLIRSVNIPIVSTALGEYDILANNYNGLGAYPRPAIAPVTTTGMGAYPAPAYEGDQYAYENAG